MSDFQQPKWNFESEPYEGSPDETTYNLRAYFDRMDDSKMRQYQPGWTDDEVSAWDGNFKDEGTLFLICSERDVDVAEYRRELENCIHYRRRGSTVG